MTLAEMLDVLSDARDADWPHTQREAQTLADGLREQLGELTDWATQLVQHLADVDETGDFMAGAESMDRPGAHTLWTEAVERLRGHVWAVA